MRVFLTVVLLCLPLAVQAEGNSGSECSGGSSEKSDSGANGNRTKNETADNKTHGQARSNETAEPEPEESGESDCVQAQGAIGGTGPGPGPAPPCQAVMVGTTPGAPFVDAEIRPECLPLGDAGGSP